MRFGTLKVLALCNLYWTEGQNHWFVCIFPLAGIIFQLNGVFGYIFYAFGDPEKSILADIGVAINYTLFVYLYLTYLITMKEITNVIRDADAILFHEFYLKLGKEKLPEETRLNIALKSIIFQLLCFGFPLYKICQRGDEFCGFTYPVYYGFDIYYSPLRQVFTLLEAVSATFNCTISCLLVNFFISLIEFLLDNLKILNHQMQYLRTIKSFSIRREHLKKCIKYHILIIELAVKIDKLTSKYLYVLFIWPIGIDFAIYAILVDYNNISWALLTIMGALFAMTIIFYFGQQLINQSSLISEIAFDVMPIDDHKLCKDLMMMSMRAQKPLILNLGSFGKVDNATYLAMLKFCYTVMTVLLNQIQN